MNNRGSIKKYWTAALITGCCFIWGCENNQRAIDELTRDRKLREEAINVESYMSQKGIVKARLKAPLMYREMGVGVDTPFVEFPQSLHVDFFNDSAVIETILDAKYGKYF